MSRDTEWSFCQLHYCSRRYIHGKVFVLADADEVLEALEDHQMQLQGMAGMGKFVDFFRDEVQITFTYVNLFEVLSVCQKYLVHFPTSRDASKL